MWGPAVTSATTDNVIVFASHTVASYSNSEKDQLEAEVSLCVKSCSKQIDRLKESALAAQQAAGPSGRPGLEGQAVAHLHGVVRAGHESWGRDSRHW